MEDVVFDPADLEKNKTNAILMAVFPILFFLPLVSADMKESRMLKFFSNQCLLLLICSAAEGVVAGVLSLIPIIGAIMSGALGILVLVLYILNLVAAANGQGKRLPVIGGIEILK